MKKVIAFADEFGNNSFDFESQGSHFIIASVIIKYEDYETVKKQLEGVCLQTNLNFSGQILREY